MGLSPLAPSAHANRVQAVEWRRATPSEAASMASCLVQLGHVPQPCLVRAVAALVAEEARWRGLVPFELSSNAAMEPRAPVRGNQVAEGHKEALAPLPLAGLDGDDWELSDRWAPMGFQEERPGAALVCCLIAVFLACCSLCPFCPLCC